MRRAPGSNQNHNPTAFNSVPEGLRSGHFAAQTGGGGIPAFGLEGVAPQILPEVSLGEGVA